jgi:hypothetical protein
LYNPLDYIGSFGYLTISVGDLRYNKRNGVNYTSDLYVSGNIYQNGTMIDLSMLSGITPGIASAGKLIAVNSNRDITNINSLSASQLTGTIQTASQPNITSLGTLSSLSVSGSISGTLSTAAQPNVTSVGSLTSLSIAPTNRVVSSGQTSTNCIWASTMDRRYGMRQIDTDNFVMLCYSAGGTYNDYITWSHLNATLTISGNVSATNISGTLATASQPNISSLGTLSSLTISGALNGTLSTATQPNITSLGTLTSLTVSGALNGTLSTAAQPNITSLGTLSSLTVSGSANLTISTSSQPNITSLGTLSSLTVSGAISGTLGTAAQPNITSIGTLATLTATSITGTLQTAAQPNITSLGTLASLTSSGTITSSRTTNGQSFNSTNGTSTCVLYHFNNGDAYFGTITANNLVFQTSNTGRMTISSSGAVSGISSLSATTLTGTLSTSSQPNITSTGDLTLPSSLTITNGTTPLSINNTTSTSTFRLTIQNSGGAQDIGSFTSHSFFLNSNNTRRLQCDTSGNIDILNHNASTVGLKLGGTLITSSATELNYLSGATQGTAVASKALVLDSNRNITNIAKINVTSSDATTMTGTTNASAFGLNILSTVNTNGQYNSSAIAFRNALSDGMPHGVILCQRTAAAAGDLVFLTQSATNNVSECLRVLSTGAIAVNAIANAGITCFGSANYVDGSYQKVLDLQSNNVSPIDFCIEINSGANTTSTNATWVGNLTNNDLRFGVNNSTKMILDTNGRLGIGTTAPSTTLHVSGIVSNTFNVGGSLYSTGTSTAYTTSQLGPVTVSVAAMFGGPIQCSSIYCTSDRRCKDIIRQVDADYCDKFYDLNVYEYKYKGSDETIPKIGFISQDLYAAGYIKLLSMTPNENLKKLDEDDIEGYQMNIDYSKITAINFCMIKKLLIRIKQLEMELKHK